MQPLTNDAIQILGISAVQLNDDLTELSLRPEGFTRLYKRFVLGVYCYLVSRLGNASDTEDLTSHVFLDAYRCLSLFQAALIQLKAEEFVQNWATNSFTSPIGCD